MMEVALCLAIIGFAVVSLLAVLPVGMDNQQATRQATVISEDATMFLEAIRGGARGMDDLTNYLVGITNYYQGYYASGQPAGGVQRTGYTFNSGLTNGLRIVGVMSTPEFTAGIVNNVGALGGMPLANTVGQAFTSNHVYAYFRSFSGMAAEKPPQDNPILRGASFTYRILCVNAPVAAVTNVSQWVDPSAVFDQQLAGNLRELRLLFSWPLTPNFTLGFNHKDQNFRVDVAGGIIWTNDYPINTLDGMWLYFCQSQSFTNTP